MAVIRLFKTSQWSSEKSVFVRNLWIKSDWCVATSNNFPTFFYGFISWPYPPWSPWNIFRPKKIKIHAFLLLHSKVRSAPFLFSGGTWNTVDNELFLILRIQMIWRASVNPLYVTFGSLVKWTVFFPENIFEFCSGSNCCVATAGAHVYFVTKKR